MKMHAIRLKYGDDLRRSIESYVKSKGIKAAAIVSCAGCVYKVCIRKADGSSIFENEEHYEIVSLQGTIATNGSHIHISLSDNNLKTIGGHLKYGTLVNTTAEIVMIEIDNYHFERVFDYQTGYEELEITEI